MAERLLTVDDVAELLQLSRSTIYRLIAQRKLRSTRIASKVRVPESAVDQLIQEGSER